MNRLVVGIIAFVVVAVIVIGAVVFFIMRDDDSEDSVVGAVVESAAPVVRADAVVVPIQSASLGMPKGGMVTDVLVRENDAVEEGQLLVRLDDTDVQIAILKAENAVASARADVETLKIAIEKERELDDEARPGKLEQARMAHQTARERYLHLSGANRDPGASVSAEGAVLEAKYAGEKASAEFAVKQAEEAILKAMGVASASGIAATSESRAMVSAREAQIAKTRLAIADMENALDDAQDHDKMVQDAEDAIIVSTVLLKNAERDLEVTVMEVEEANRLAQEAYDDAEFDWRMVHKYYMGIELTAEEMTETPDDLFDEWGVNLADLFNRRHAPILNDEFKDNPDTRWNELKLFGLLYLHPFPSTHLVSCEGIDIPKGMRCIEKDYEDAWEAFKVASEALTTMGEDGVTAVDAARNKIVTAQNRLEDAERALELVQSGRARANVDSIQAEMDAANAALAALMDYRDDAEVAQAEANLVVAKAVLADMQPSAQEISLARQQVADLEVRIAKLEAGRDPLDEERREARIVSAESRVSSAETVLESARMTLDDLELRAPFGGVVVALNVDAGEEVGPRQVVMNLADTSEWELFTVDLDELSVVNLSEGEVVKVSFDALPELEMSGTVSRISRYGRELKGSMTYSAEIRLSGNDPRLRWGMTASIRK